MGGVVITKEEKGMLMRLGKHIKEMLKLEGVPIRALKDYTKVNSSTLDCIKKGKNITLLSLIRLCYSFGYDIALVKRADAKNILDDPEAMVRLLEFRNKNNIRLNKRKGYEDGIIPIRRKVRLNDKAMEVISMKMQLDNEVKKDDDFLKIDD